MVTNHWNKDGGLKEEETEDQKVFNMELEVKMHPRKHSRVGVKMKEMKK